MKTIAAHLALVSLAVVGSSCKNQEANTSTNTSSGYEEYGYYSGPQESSNPYATESTPAPSARDNDYVSVTPTAPQNSGGATQMPAYQDAVVPVPPQPSPAYGDTSSPSAGLANTHVVSQGETLYGISRIYGATVEGIKSANGLDSNLIRPGDVLNIP